MRPAHVLLTGPGLAQRLARTTDDALNPVQSELLVRRDAARLRRMAGEGGCARPVGGSLLVYRLQQGGHQQTGVVVEVPVEDYRSGRVRRHEAIRPERERRLEELLAAAELDLVPVTLAHPARSGLRALLAKATTDEPDLHLCSDDGLVQTVWDVRTGGLARAAWAELDALGSLYIADGHHRMAAAERHAARHCPDGGDDASCYVLAAVFPSDEMRVLGYHRCLTRPRDTPTTALLDALAEQPGARRLEECAPEDVPGSGPGVVPVWLDGRWYRLWLRPAPGSQDARAALDVVALEEGVLGPLLGTAADPRSDPRVTTLPGGVDAEAMARRCSEDGTIGFLLHPPSIEQVMAVADARDVMPPKSTWFDPKARAGPFVRDLSSRP